MPGLAGIIEEEGHFHPTICPIDFYGENGSLVRVYLGAGDLNGSVGYLKLSLKATLSAWYSWEN